MNHWVKYIMKIGIFFLVTLFIFFLLDIYYKDTNILLNAIAATLAYIITLLINKLKRNKSCGH